jgi:hypothetical protein
MSCSKCEIAEITCDYADAVNAKIREMRFGITSCCTEDYNKAWVKNELAQLNLIADSDTVSIITQNPILINAPSFGECCN